MNVSIIIQHEWIDLSRKYPPTTVQFELRKRSFVVAHKSQDIRREGASKWWVSRVNEVKELILGLVCNAISSLSMQLEWKKTSPSKYSIGWLLWAVQLCWKVSVLMAMWVGGSLQPGTTTVHCCVRGFPAALSNLCQELAIVKGFELNCSLCSLGHVCSWTLKDKV